MLSDKEIEAIADGQTEVTYEANGPFLVKTQIEHAIKQALLLNEGETITLPNGKVMTKENG